MAYANGTLHGYNTEKGFIPPVKTTAIYCDNCALVNVPFDDTMPEGRKHWNSGFRWYPNFADKCHCCGKEC